MLKWHTDLSVGQELRIKGVMEGTCKVLGAHPPSIFSTTSEHHISSSHQDPGSEERRRRNWEERKAQAGEVQPYARSEGTPLPDVLVYAIKGKPFTRHRGVTVARTLPVLVQRPPTIRRPTSFPPVAVTPTITDLLKAGAPIGIGLSGGKDSGAMAYALQAYLDEIGHGGPRLGIHGDLGIIEWRDSQRICEEVAGTLGLELVVIHTNLIERWRTRWLANVQRYTHLLCVKLIMPWSTLQLRFCSGEKKVTPICNELVRRFPGCVILSAAGLRHDESEQRKNALVCKEQPKLLRKKLNTSGYSWNPLVEWTENDVYAYHHARGIPLHPAYTAWGCSRVSCAYCIASTRTNMLRATLCKDNHAAYLQLVPLEIASTFSFTSNMWLGDLAPHLLGEETHQAFLKAKDLAKRRENWEKKIPPHLLYHKGWPTLVPSWDEARLLGEVRRAVAGIVGIEALYTQTGDIRDRYAELMALNAQKEARKRKKTRAE